MNRTHIKMSLRRRDDESIDCTVFAGNEGQTLQNCGTLVLRIGEWQLLGVALGLGYDSYSSIKQHLYYSVEGEEEALNG